MKDYEIRPVTGDYWSDFASLFEARGGPHFCWCTLYRFSNTREMSKLEKKSCMQALVAASTPIGVLAYAGDQAVGWCSMAPRETYSKLERSRKMPRVTPPETPTWMVLCFFVLSAYRGQGLAGTLLRGAIAYASSMGARVIEAYPFDTAGITATHRGHSSLFRKAGFQRDDKRWFLELQSK